MSTRIVTDSTCDLPAEMAEKFGIRIIPNYINIGEKSFLDGVDISHEEFYKGLPNFPAHPKTSAPGSGMFSSVYQQLANEGARHIISLYIHSGLSNLSNAARVGAEAIQGVQITVLEVGQLALGLGFMALAAAQAALDGMPTTEIIDGIRNQDRRTIIYAALNTLDYLRESGRAPGLLVGVAKLLRIKPIIQLHKGVLRLAGQVRTGSKSIDWLASGLKKLGRLNKVAVLHTHAPERAEILAGRIHRLLPTNKKILISEVTPILGVHIGPGAVGLACVNAE